MQSQELPFGLQPETTPGALVEAIDRLGWRLSIPAGPGGRYRLAQLDNYKARRRAAFPHQTPFSLALEARASAPDLRGTWGFGVWNDPFSMGALTGGSLRFPLLPNTAWFFFASPENHLSLRDDLPTSGTMAATFDSPRKFWLALASGAAALPLMTLPWGRRMARRLAARVVQQDAAPFDIDPSDWHSYRLEWQAGQVRFEVDGAPLLCTKVSPRGRLGLVVWIDNQYAAFRPDGSLGYGTLETCQPAWIEVRDLRSE